MSTSSVREAAPNKALQRTPKPLRSLGSLRASRSGHAELKRSRDAEAASSTTDWTGLRPVPARYTDPSGGRI